MALNETEMKATYEKFMAYAEGWCPDAPDGALGQYWAVAVGDAYLLGSDLKDANGDYWNTIMTLAVGNLHRVLDNV